MTSRDKTRAFIPVVNLVRCATLAPDVENGGGVLAYPGPAISKAMGQDIILRGSRGRIETTVQET